MFEMMHFVSFFHRNTGLRGTLETVHLTSTDHSWHPVQRCSRRSNGQLTATQTPIPGTRYAADRYPEAQTADLSVQHRPSGTIINISTNISISIVSGSIYSHTSRNQCITGGSSMSHHRYTRMTVIDYIMYTQ